MNTSPERKRVRDEIADWLALHDGYQYRYTDEWVEAHPALNDFYKKYEQLADQILSIKGILIEADDQTPERLYTENDLPAGIEATVIDNMLNAGFRKVVKE